jgi:hypothetical protein
MERLRAAARTGKALTRIRALAAEEKIRLTLMTLRELAAMGLDARDERE